MEDDEQDIVPPSYASAKNIRKSLTTPINYKEKLKKANQNKVNHVRTIIKPGLSKGVQLRKFSSKRNILTNKQATLALMKNLSLNDPNQQNIDEKFNLDQLGRIEYAKQHSSANRPLNKLKNFKTNQVFCRCCGLPCITKGVIEPFKVCDNTDKYSILGQAISLYYSFYKFSIFILIVLLFSLIVPSFIMTNHYYFSISKICNNILEKKGTIEFSLCERFIIDQEYLNNNSLQSKETFKFQFNGENTNTYIELYNDIMTSLNNGKDILDDKSYGKKMNNVVVNQSVSYFIVLMCLFIINLLYIVFQNNKILDYNCQLISPSDYAVIMTNMSHVYKSFRRMKYRYLRSNKISSKKEFRKKLGFTDNDLSDKSITDAMEFRAFIKNFIINKNQKFNVQLVNICYKLNKFKKLEEEIQVLKNELFKVDNNPKQIRRNKYFKLKGNRRIYFASVLNEVNYFNLNTNCCERRIPIIEILRKKKNKEHELNDLLEASKNIKKDNFANVAFISFDTISEQEKFLNQYSKNWFTGLLSTLKNFKYYFCSCLLSKEDKNKWERENEESVSCAPEPDDIIFENLETTKLGRIKRTLITTMISFIIIAISFIIVVLLTMAQEKIDNMSFGAKNFSKYAVSLGITVVTSLVNIIFQGLLESLTKVERHISITDQNLSFSVKLTIFTFVNSSIVPLISNALSNLSNIAINYDLLVSNILINFIVNAVVSPTMWSINPGFYYKKWRIWNIENKINPHNMTQRELNELYEYWDIELAYKYSYIFKTLLQTFFYLPIFPLGIVFSICGLILAFYLEKYNIGHIYKRPEMMNETICKFYVNFFEVNFLMLALGDYIFLNNNFAIEYWPIINISVFFILLIIPYGQYLNFNLIGINQSQIINKKYDEVYFTFYNDYERMNPFTRKIGTINYLKRLKEKDYISEEEFQIQKRNIEKLSFMQIMSQAKPNRANRAKRSLGKKQALLHNVVFDETDKKAKRLFELIKKLYLMPEEEDDSYYYDDYIKNNRVMKRNINIPNILHLVGTIFGTEEEKDESSTKMFLHDMDSEMNEVKLLQDKKYKRKTAYFGKRVNLNKIRNNSPFIISFANKNKLISRNIENNEGNINNHIIDSNNNIINTNNNNINNNYINTTTNLISKEDDFSTNKIMSEIRSEISRGGKNLIRFTNCSVHLKYQNKDETKSNDGKDNNEKNNNNNIIDNIDNNRNNNMIKKNNNNNLVKNNNNNSNNLNKNKSKFPFISNISVTINQFFEKFKSSQKEENMGSDRQNMNNATDANNDNNENENDNNDNDIKENIIEEKRKDNNNNYVFNSTKTIRKSPLNRKELEEMNNRNNNKPINNIINIVLRNDNNNNNNNDNNNKTNDNEEEGETERGGKEGDIYFNKFFKDNNKK